MITIRKLNCGMYRVHHLLTNHSDQIYKEFNQALDLCRLRIGTILKENKIKVIKVPFIGLWLVW